MDADRKAIYENKAAETLAPELTKLSSKYDFQVVDLNSVFRNDWQKKSGKRLILALLIVIGMRMRIIWLLALQHPR